MNEKNMPSHDNSSKAPSLVVLTFSAAAHDVRQLILMIWRRAEGLA